MDSGVLFNWFLNLTFVNNVIVREASLEDAPAIARVHVDTWRTTYRGIIPEDYLATLSYQQRVLGNPRGIGLGKVKILIPKSAKNMETWCPLRSHSDGINAAL